MPVSYEIFKEMKLIVSHQTGHTDDDEIMRVYKAMYADPDFDPSYDKLIDLREADSRGRDPDVLEIMAHFADEKYSEIQTKPKVAIIAPKDLTFGFGRMYDGMSAKTGEDLQVFRTAADACNWLEIDPDFLDLD
jgi:hypothetical protein